MDQGLQQEDAGADVLDVNVGTPEINEVELLDEVVCRLQSVLALPLQIDTSNPEAMERALRHYNGKALINSVNGKQEVMAEVFPLVKKYGGVVVALALDEGGIPDNADDRIRIAEKIYATAADYGIRREDIVIDGLCMTVSSDPRSALVTLETIRRIRDELGGSSILGVSNISFGLPARELINAYFFEMALQNGLSCAIINPNNQAMMQAYRAFCALTNQDENFQNFIAAYAGYKSPDKQVSDALTAYKTRVLNALGVSAGDLQATGRPLGGSGGNAGGAGAGAGSGFGAGTGSAGTGGAGASSGNVSGAGAGAGAAGAGFGPGVGSAGAGANAGSFGSGSAAGADDGRGPGALAGKSRLVEAIERGMAKPATEATREALLSRNALDIINQDLVPALDVVGQGFEKGTVFLPQLLMAVYEMCGGFAVFRPSEAIEEAMRKYWRGGTERLGFWRRVTSAKGAPTSLWMHPPLLDIDELKRFASEVAGHRGARPLAEAAELMTGPCESPFEVQTSLLLGLPRRLGGMGFTDIENNKVIRLSSEARSLCGKSECRADVYLGARDSARPVDIECQGAVVHDSGESAISDSRRIAALQSMGIDVVPVTFDQISDARSFDALAALVAKRSGRRLAPKTKGLQRRELDLRRNVLIDWNTLGE